MEAEGRAGDDERAARLAQVEAMRARGEEPYPVRFDRSHTLAEVREHWGERVETGETTDDVVSVAGRVVGFRVQGKLVFANLRERSVELQLFVNKAELGDDAFARFVDEIDRGDWVGVTGTMMKTKKGELSVNVKEFSLLAKAVRPLPEKWHGLADTDTRFRQRYVDLIANDDARRVFAIRFGAIASMRALLAERGFLEVETPVLHPILGGATARPFVTHHNALDTDFYLRVAPELYLKRLIVGGLDKVFEVARVFRNEGVSTRHNPEFTMLELYEAFSDYTDMMRLTEQLIAGAASDTLGSTVVEWDGQTIDLTPPFARRTMIDLVKEHAGVSVHPSQPVEDVRKVCDDLDVKYEAHWGSGKLLLEIYEKTTEANLVAPTFVCDYPTEVSPLARTHRDDPTLTERFELLIGGREIANAFSELNDPVEQRRRFEAQAELKRHGDAEANDVDDDYVRALEYGLPPCGGMGMGIDRIVMLLAGVTSIKEVILFPHMRPEAGNLRQEDAVTSERVLITGMGGELGTRVAQLIEQRSWAGEVVGVDFVPPRRRLRRAVFHRIDPRDRDRLAEFVEDFAPSVVADFGVYEPASRMSPLSAIERTELCTIATMSAAARGGNLAYVVVRSGLEVYGPLTLRASVPDEDVMPEPRTPYGRSLLEVESIVAGLRLRSGVPVCALRYAPVVGPHVPSPVGRLLRLPVVPVPAFADPPFSLLHPDDAAAAMVAAIDKRYDGPLNVVGPGAATPWQSVRLGGRVPLPVVGPLWDVAARVVELAGAAVAPHVIEQLRHGRTGAGDRAVDALGLGDLVPTQTVLRELFEWADVIPIPTSREQVA